MNEIFSNTNSPFFIIEEILYCSYAKPGVDTGVLGEKALPKTYEIDRQRCHVQTFHS